MYFILFIVLFESQFYGSLPPWDFSLLLTFINSPWSVLCLVNLVSFWFICKSVGYTVCACLYTAMNHCITQLPFLSTSESERKKKKGRDRERERRESVPVAVCCIQAIEDNRASSESVWEKYILCDLLMLTEATSTPPTPSASSWD